MGQLQTKLNTSHGKISGSQRSSASLNNIVVVELARLSVADSCRACSAATIRTGPPPAWLDPQITSYLFTFLLRARAKRAINIGPTMDSNMKTTLAGKEVYS